MLLKKKFLFIFAGLVLLTLISCRGVVNYDPETRLQERIEGFIQARQDKDQIALQSFYLNPGKARIGNIRYVATKVEKIDYSDERKSASVKLRNNMQVMGFVFKDTPQTVHWSWQKGDWYLIVKSGASTPFTKETNMKKKSTKDAADQKK